MGARRIAGAGRAIAVLSALLSLWAIDFWPRWPAARFGDCDARPLKRISPGTRIPDTAPEGWTHLIVKSYSELATGDIEKVRQTAFPLAKLFFTAIVARVQPVGGSGRPPLELDEVAIGVGTRIGQEDVIITTKTQRELGADLNLLQQIVLAMVERRVDQVREVARSETMSIVDVPALVLREGEHRDIVLRYVFLIHPDSGRLATVVWPIEADASGAHRLAAECAVVRPSNLIVTCPLHVDGKEVLAGIPSARAFAAARLPRGTALAIPPFLRTAAAQPRLTAEAARQLESQLRQAIAFPRPH